MDCSHLCVDIHVSGGSRMSLGQKLEEPRHKICHMTEEQYLFRTLGASTPTQQLALYLDSIYPFYNCI
jgi:hypothetical protein